MKNLKEITVRGGVAKMCGQAANVVLRIGFTAVMARLLEPRDFGLVAMVTAVTGIYSMFTHAGLSAATIQKDSITHEQISTLFWINLLIGGLLALLCVATGPVLVAFYDEPRLFWLSSTIAVSFLLHAAGVQHWALLARRLRYVTLTMMETLSLLGSIVVGVAMALAGYEYWALVGSTITLELAQTAGVWTAARWVPGLPHRAAGVKSMLSFGGAITLYGVVSYLTNNLDKVLIGRAWGADALGVYGRAYQIIHFPTASLNMAVGDVAFSALSRLQNDPARYKRTFLKVYSLLSSMSIPITIFCGLCAEDIILVLLGPKWMDAVQIFRLLTPTIVIFGIIHPFFWLLSSIGLAGRSLKIALVMAPIVAAAYFIGLPYGPNGVALAFSTVMTLCLVPYVVWCVHGTVISPGDLFLAVSRPIVAGLAAAAVVYLVQTHIGRFVQIEFPLLRLAVDGSVMAAVYFSVLLFALGQRDLYLDVLRTLKARSQGAGS